MKNWIRIVKLQITRWIRFVSWDMWRMSDEDLTGPRSFWVKCLKAIVSTIQAFINDDLFKESSALTYSTVLSIVPLLAVIVGIAKGFGLQEILYNSLMEYLPSHEHELQIAFQSVDNYLSQIKGGLFLGLGLIILLYTVINLISIIETTFNNIWQTKTSRSWATRIVNYMAFIVLSPVLIVVSSGITIMMGTFNNTFFADYIFIQPIMTFFLNLAPFVMVIMMFTIMYIIMPNVRVKFMPALISGVVAGVAFQLFQYLYINGVLWISKYNAIYGSFAVFPLMLLWLNLSWTITLFGAQLSYSIQNLSKFSFEKESNNISRRYFDFIVIVMMSYIVKRFMEEESEPYTAEKLSNQCHVPMRLTNLVLRKLQDVGMIVEISYGNKNVGEYFQPAIPVNRITVGELLKRLDRAGSENFKIDKNKIYKSEWDAMKASRSGLEGMEADRLLSEL